MKTIYLLFAFILLNLLGCKPKQVVVQSTLEPQVKDTVVPVAKEEFKLGVEMLQKSGFELLKGKRVGLVTNPTGVDSHLKSTIDILYENKEVNLVALFAPEHGVRGDFSAGDHVKNQVDAKTGIPVFSLYGKDKKPNKQAMDMIDILVYDIQDIGVRSYTYISTMGQVMEAASDFGKSLLILDRPNPLGGDRIEGSLVEDGLYSFVSRYNIPYVYGMTCGELALFLNNEGLLTDGKKCDIQVVKMAGWHRDMTYDETGLVWVPTSPHIPTWQTAFYYASTGIIGELDPNYIGIGYTLPFQTLVTPDINAELLCKNLNNLGLRGVIFRPIYYKPYYQSKAGQELQGAQIHITDFKTVDLTGIQFHFLIEAMKLNPDFKPFNVDKSKKEMFDIVCGTHFIQKAITEKQDYSVIEAYWNKDVEAFRQLSKKYYLYK